MFYAMNSEGGKIEVTPKGRGFCPFCGMGVIACTGEIKSHYWRHEQKAKTDCVASFYEHEGIWHSDWKMLFGKEYGEIFCQIGNQKRVADVKLPNGLVIEIQHSHIPPKEIRARESFHKNMIWIFDASGAVADERLAYSQTTFSWEQPRLSIKSCKCPVYLDLGSQRIFRIDDYREQNYYNKEETFLKAKFTGTGKLLARHILIDDIKIMDSELNKPKIIINKESVKERIVRIKANQLNMFDDS